MSLKYTCPGCGTPLGYEGLCWKCKAEQERKAALAWTPEQITEKQRNLIQNIQRLADMEDPEFTDFWQLLGYTDMADGLLGLRSIYPPGDRPAAHGYLHRSEDQGTGVV